MRILLQNCSTNCFFDAKTRWTTDVNQAQIFDSVSKARELAWREKLEQFQLYLKFESGRVRVIAGETPAGFSQV